MPSITGQLIDNVLAIKYKTLPAAAIDMAEACALDGIAVMLAGATEPLGLERIVELVENLEQLPNIDELMSLARG